MYFVKAPTEQNKVRNQIRIPDKFNMGDFMLNAFRFAALYIVLLYD